MTKLALAYLATGAVFLILDIAWLSTMANVLYRPTLGDIMAPDPQIAPAAVFYLLFIAGIVFFAVAPAFETGRWQTALLNGALFGLFAYATYDLTNQATLRNWTTMLTLADLAWGTFVTAASATFGFLIAAAISRTIGA